jgi:hypothetical protein
MCCPQARSKEPEGGIPITRRTRDVNLSVRPGVRSLVVLVHFRGIELVGVAVEASLMGWTNITGYCAMRG